MAQHKSAEKSIRQAARRAEINRSRRSRVQTFVRKLEEALAAGNKEAATAAFRDAQKELARAVSKGTLKAGTASRNISRLNAKVKNLATGAPKDKAATPAKKKAVRSKAKA